MNRQKPHIEPFVRRHRPFFVALFVTFPILTMVALLVFTLLKNDRFQQWCTLHVIYENSQGLKRGHQVSMSGITVGHVKNVDLIKEKKVQVTFDIAGRYRHLVKKDTKALLKQRGFVGDWEIELIGGTPEAGEVDDDDFLTSEKMLSVDDVIELAGGIIDTGIALLMDIASIVRGLEDGRGTMGQLLKNDTLFKHVNRISTDAVVITSDIKKITAGAQNTMRGADSMIAQFTDLGKDIGKSGLTFIDTLSTLVNTVSKSLEDIDRILKNLKTVSDDAPELMDRLQRDLDEAERMLKTFQDGWLFRSIGGSPKNPHLADSP